MTVAQADRASADDFQAFIEILDQQRDTACVFEDYHEVLSAASALYEATESRVPSVLPKRAIVAPDDELDSNSDLVAYQALLTAYLEDEDNEKDYRHQSPLSNYIAGFVLDVPHEARSGLTEQFGALGVFAAVPDDLTVDEASLARILSLRLFGGWSLAKIATHDGMSLGDAKLSWARARQWATNQADLSPVVDVSFDSLDRQVLRVLAETPELIHALEWRTFERVLAATLDKIGFQVELQRGTKDGGIDVIAIKADRVFGQHRYLIQAKRWRGKVGVAPVRELLFLKQKFGATKACLATTAHFTRGARRLAREHWWELELRDFEQLQLWIAEASSG